MKDRSDDPSHHELTLLPRSYILLRMVGWSAGYVLLFSVHNRYEFSPADLDHDIYFIYDCVWTTTSGFLPAPNGVYLTRRPSGKGTCCDSSEGGAIGSRGTLSDCITCTCPTNPGPATHKHVGRVLFNDALNTFYLRLYGVGKQLTEHTLPEVKEGNVLFNDAINTLFTVIWKEGRTWYI